MIERGDEKDGPYVLLIEQPKGLLVGESKKMRTNKTGPGRDHYF